MESLNQEEEQATQKAVDRRLSERREVSYLRLLSPMPARILDLSRGGLALEAMVELRVGKMYQLRIRHRKRVVALSGKVRSCRRSREIRYSNDKSLPLYRVGFELSKQLSAADLDFLSLDGRGPRRITTLVESPSGA